MATASLKQWAREQGIHPVTADRWFPSGKLPVPARRVGHLILVDVPARPSAGVTARSRVPCRSAGRRDRQVARVTPWAAEQPPAIGLVVTTEIGSALNGRGWRFLALGRDPSVATIVVERRTASLGSGPNPWKPRWPRRAGG